MKVEQWGSFEIVLQGKEIGNSFREVSFTAEFIHESGKKFKPWVFMMVMEYTNSDLCQN